MNAQLSGLLEKEVSRKEFLGMSGLAVASIFGLGTIVKLMSGKSLGSHAGLQQAGSSYGSSAYGGTKR